MYREGKTAYLSSMRNGTHSAVDCRIYMSRNNFDLKIIIKLDATENHSEISRCA